MIEKAMNVEGMSCAHCKAAVEEELSKLSGIEYSNADPEKGTVEVRYDEAKVTNDDLDGAVEEAATPSPPDAARNLLGRGGGRGPSASAAWLSRASPATAGRVTAVPRGLARPGLRRPSSWYGPHAQEVGPH